jgi:hypothetical protein
MNVYKASLKNVHLEPLDKPSKLKLKAVIIAEFELAMGWSMELTPDCCPISNCPTYQTCKCMIGDSRWQVVKE